MVGEEVASSFLGGGKSSVSVSFLNSITALRLEQWRKIEAVTGWV